MSANNNARANGATSAPTAEASVGHRPVATPVGGKDLEVSGTLITGDTLTINKFFITDADGNGEGTDKKEANLAKTLAGTPGSSGVTPVPGVKWELVKGGNTTALTANPDNSLTIPAEAAGGKIKVTYTVHTATGKPDVAHQSTSIILTPANSGAGLAPDGNIDGTVSARLAGVTIKVNGTPTNELNGTTTAGTPIVGSTIEAELTCAVASYCANPETKYDFQWQMADFTTPDVFTDIPDTDPEATSMTYTVKGDQQNKLFKVVVTPKTTKADAPVSKAKRR
ncbi:hypothetical protein V9U04_004888 [Salmonella enterica subsp. enterica]